MREEAELRLRAIDLALTFHKDMLVALIMSPNDPERFEIEDVFVIANDIITYVKTGESPKDSCILDVKRGKPHACTGDCHGH